MAVAKLQLKPSHHPVPTGSGGCHFEFPSAVAAKLLGPAGRDTTTSRRVPSQVSRRGSVFSTSGAAVIFCLSMPGGAHQRWTYLGLHGNLAKVGARLQLLLSRRKTTIPELNLDSRQMQWHRRLESVGMSWSLDVTGLQFSVEAKRLEEVLDEASQTFVPRTWWNPGGQSSKPGRAGIKERS